MSRDDKPFECVGERRESAAALRLLAAQPGWRDAPVVAALAPQAEALVSDADVADLFVPSGVSRPSPAPRWGTTSNASWWAVGDPRRAVRAAGGGVGSRTGGRGHGPAAERPGCRAPAHRRPARGRPERDGPRRNRGGARSGFGPLGFGRRRRSFARGRPVPRRAAGGRVRRGGGHHGHGRVAGGLRRCPGAGRDRHQGQVHHGHPGGGDPPGGRARRGAHRQHRCAGDRHVRRTAGGRLCGRGLLLPGGRRDGLAGGLRADQPGTRPSRLAWRGRGLLPRQAAPGRRRTARRPGRQRRQRRGRTEDRGPSEPVAVRTGRAGPASPVPA